MKKTMIAMGAIMSLALGAFAVGVTSGTLKNAVMFDGIAPGTSIVSGQFDSQYTTADGYTSYIGDGGAHWECTGSTEDSVITNLTGSLNDNFLQIDQTDTLYRWMNQIEADSTNAVSAGQGIYFASKVQFTASDETNGVNLVSDASDKLLIWLRAADTNEDDVVDGTNLVITASVGFPGNNKKADFVISNFDVVPGTWYELLVKSDFYDNGSQQGIQFTVKMAPNGTTSEADFTTLKTSDEVDTFYSMDGTGDDKATVTKVGFKGTGAVDNLEFGTYNVAVENYFSVNGTPYPSFDAAMEHVQPGDVVELLQNYNVNSGTPITLEYGEEVVLDLAGHVISMDENDYAVILNGGVLTITNSTVEVGCVYGGAAAAVINEGTLTIVGGKYYGYDGSEGEGDEAVQNAGTMTVYYISNGTATESVLEQVDSGDDAGYWVIEEKSGPVQTQVTAYLSLNPEEATYDENKATPADYTQVTVVFSNDTEQVDALVLGTDYTITWSADTVTNATSDYVCTVTAAGTAYTFETVTATLSMLKYVPTWEVTFSTNNISVAVTNNVVDGQSLAADQIPAFTGGAWDVDPTNAVITCATNFNYTISGSNWPEAWNDNNEPASMKGVFDTWIAVPGNDPAAENAEAAFLSGVNVADYTNDFAVATIAIVNGKVQLTGNYDLNNVNGAILLLTGDTPSTFTTTNAVEKSTTIEITPESEETKKFYKLVLGYPAN